MVGVCRLHVAGRENLLNLPDAGAKPAMNSLRTYRCLPFVPANFSDDDGRGSPLGRNGTRRACRWPLPEQDGQQLVAQRSRGFRDWRVHWPESDFWRTRWIDLPHVATLPWRFEALCGIIMAAEHAEAFVDCLGHARWVAGS